MNKPVIMNGRIATIIIKFIIYDVNNFKNFVFNKFINISHDDEMLTKKNEIFSKTCDIEPDATLKWVALRETSLSRKWFGAIRPPSPGTNSLKRL